MDRAMQKLRTHAPNYGVQETMAHQMMRDFHLKNPELYIKKNSSISGRHYDSIIMDDLADYNIKDILMTQQIRLHTEARETLATAEDVAERDLERALVTAGNSDFEVRMLEEKVVQAVYNLAAALLKNDARWRAVEEKAKELGYVFRED